MSTMDVRERAIVNLLGEVWNAFLELPELHSVDRIEFMHAIHDAQRIVMARPTLRAMAEEALPRE